MAYIQVWVKATKVQGVKTSLQQFVRYTHDFYEIEAERLGGKMVLLVYKRVPGRLFMKQLESASGIVNVLRIKRSKKKKP